MYFNLIKNWVIQSKKCSCYQQGSNSESYYIHVYVLTFDADTLTNWVRYGYNKNDWKVPWEKRYEETRVANWK